MPDPAWNRTERIYPDALLHEAVAAQAARDPAAPALHFRSATLSYGQFDAQVNALAHRLVALGVGTETLVAVCMERSLELVVTLHAVMRAGGAYVPLDPDYPDERLAVMLEDLDGPVLLTQERWASRFRGAPAQVVYADAPVESVASPAGAELPKVAPDDLAYVIYTSGSTGKPKGAMNTHRGIANRLYWMQERYSLTPSDKVLQKTPFTFDVSVWEFFWPLLVGAQLVVAEPAGHRDPGYLTRTIVEHGITTVHFVPSMLQVFLESPHAGECTSLRRVICSGESLPRALQDRFFACLGSVELHNLYGPTEAAVDVSAWQCSPADPHPFVPIGKPVANTQLHILDADMNQVPTGEVGELHIGGVQVGRGYLNRPDLTAERFVADPFRAGGRLYKTGDLARFMPDGNVEFLGRSDFQVKVRGFRIELGEIESALEAIEGVRGAVVVARPGKDGSLALVAYVAHQAGRGMPIDDVRTHLSERLPEFMVPRVIVALAHLPLNPNGKVDRNALPEPPVTRPDLASTFVAPRSPLEKSLAGMWREILGLDLVGINDTFFDLGGSSLQAARFVNQVQGALNELIPVVSIFASPTVAEYALMLETDFPESVIRWLGDAGTAWAESARTRPVSASGGSSDSRDPTTAVRLGPDGSGGGSLGRRHASLAAQRQRREAARGEGSSQQ